MSVQVKKQKISLPAILQKKKVGKPVIMLTACDYPGAVLADESDVDIILVGDSLAMTVLGHPDTISITVDEMLHHCRAVARGTRRALLVGDMPFLSYQVSPEEAIHNAGRFLKEGQMDAVKLEGGLERLDKIEAVLNAGIPVMGHVGLTPQSATKLGGYRVQGKSIEQAKKILADALALEEAGCFSLVIELVPAPLAELISKKLTIPTIGIGAGAGCDGQVLVFHDILGLFDQFKPKFVKQFANVRKVISTAIDDYCREIDNREFPTADHSFAATDAELVQFIKEQSAETGDAGL